MKMTKKVIIELEINAESSSDLRGNLLEQAVEKDLPRMVELRLGNMSGDVGCYKDGKSFGYSYTKTGVTIEDVPRGGD